MEQFETLLPLQARLDDWKRAGDRIVLVPTMGALHAGHEALMAHARSLGNRVVASIFVNPTQFGRNEDFDRYPRNANIDISKLVMSGVDAVWLPQPNIMYPESFSTKIDVGRLGKVLCGLYRPDHFSGVATIVVKLLNQIKPDIALFGQKDFQQLRVIRKVVQDLNIPIRIESMPTVRENDGLALSSRNIYLSTAERVVAPKLYETLEKIATIARARGDFKHELNSAVLSLKHFGFGPVQYLCVCDTETLEPIHHVQHTAHVLAAAYLGSTRLIDNVAI